MTMQRENPLPLGTYWIDVFGENRPKFNAWLTAFAPVGVKSEVTQSFDSDPPRDWHKFSVTGTVPWDAKTFGYPTIITPTDNVQSSEDTVQRPDLPQDPLVRLGAWVEDIEKRVGGPLGMLIPYALIGGAAYASYLLFAGFRENKKRKKRT